MKFRIIIVLSLFTVSLIPTLLRASIPEVGLRAFEYRGYSLPTVSIIEIVLAVIVNKGFTARSKVFGKIPAWWLIVPLCLTLFIYGIFYQQSVYEDFNDYHHYPGELHLNSPSTQDGYTPGVAGVEYSSYSPRDDFVAYSVADRLLFGGKDYYGITIRVSEALTNIVNILVPLTVVLFVYQRFKNTSKLENKKFNYFGMGIWLIFMLLVIDAAMGFYFISLLSFKAYGLFGNSFLVDINNIPSFTFITLGILGPWLLSSSLRRKFIFYAGNLLPLLLLMNIIAVFLVTRRCVGSTQCPDSLSVNLANLILVLSPLAFYTSVLNLVYYLKNKKQHKRAMVIAAYIILSLLSALPLFLSLAWMFFRDLLVGY